MALRDTARPESAGPASPVTPPLADADRGRLLSGSHHDPHALLGAHPVPGGSLFRALRPGARSVSVVFDDPEITIRTANQLRATVTYYADDSEFSG